MPARKLTLASTSSFVDDAAYDEETETLEITFSNGRTYSFPGVPADVAEGLASADSPGAYFHNHIKGQY